MIQPSFNFEIPRSRRKDPLSSHRAESSMRRSGALRGQQLIALELVKQYPGRSSKELADLGPLDRYQLARRLPELAQMGYVRREIIEDQDCKWWEA